MKKLIGITLALLMLCAPAFAEVCDMGGFSFEVPAGYINLQSEDGALYVSDDNTVALICTAMPSGGATLSDAMTFYQMLYFGEDANVSEHTVRDIPFGCVSGKCGDFEYGSANIFLDGENAYCLIMAVLDKSNFDEAQLLNILMSVQVGGNTAEDAAGSYEIVSTSEYARTPYKGMVYRVYCPEELTAELAQQIFDEVSNDGFAIHTVFFYDMRSAAEGGGSAIGRMLQDDPTVIPEFEPMN